ncbi:MAG: hypothetical protein IIB82_13180 [Bacteroidetes bacterium]|nr:hypothetical protein [Bacteroidota bacterium]
MEKDPDLISLQGDIRHSGEGKWAAQTALEFEIPALVITYSLLSRFGFKPILYSCSENRKNQF